MDREMPFEVPTHTLDPEELRTIVKAVSERLDLWTDALRQTTRERTYAEVHTSDHLGVWAISWMADDHDTGYHDHHGCNGAVVVVRGAIRHERLRLEGNPDGTAVHAGDGFCFDDTFVHRMRREPGAGETVTIHAYSPPLLQTGQYSEVPGEGYLRRHAAPAEEQLIPHGPQGEPTEPGSTA